MNPMIAAATTSLADLTALANRMTFHRARAEAMGFKFRNIVVEEPMFGGVHHALLRCGFKCLCGRHEEFSRMFPIAAHGDFLRELTDVAFQLLQSGAFSRAHLIADGYTEQQVDEIEARGKAFDDDCRAALRRSAP